MGTGKLAAGGMRVAAGLLLGPSPSLRAGVALLRRRPANELAGTRVLVTGASAGIGAATARLLAGLGAEVYLVARREAELQAVCDEISAAGGLAHGRACDVTDAEQVDALVAEVVAAGGVDILVNNAGRSIRRSVLESVDRFHDYERTMALNYIAPTAVYASQPALTAEQAAGWVLRVIRTRELEVHPRNVDLLRLVSLVSPRLMDAAVRAAGI